jgi:hypothetical protein
MADQSATCCALLQVRDDADMKKIVDALSKEVQEMQAQVNRINAPNMKANEKCVCSCVQQK